MSTTVSLVACYFETAGEMPEISSVLKAVKLLLFMFIVAAAENTASPEANWIR